MLKQGLALTWIATALLWVSCRAPDQESGHYTHPNGVRSLGTGEVKTPEASENDKDSPVLNSASGGSVVGNGLKVYQSKGYNFSFSYPERLTLTVESAEHIIVNDKTDPSDQKPEVDFKITYSQAVSSEAFYRNIQISRPDVEWTALCLSGVRGYYYRTETGDNLHTYYFFNLYPGTTLEVTSIDRIDREERSELNSIVESLSFDVIPPEVHELKFERSVISAGETAKLMFKASDNISSVHGLNPSGTAESGNFGFFGSTVGECMRLRFRYQYSPLVSECMVFKDEGGGWYSYSLATRVILKPGLYTLSSFKLWDGAGNILQSEPIKSGSDSFRIGERTYAIPLIAIENDRADITSPEISEAYFVKSVVEAGESVLLSFALWDEDPYARATRCTTLVRQYEINDPAIWREHIGQQIKSWYPSFEIDGRHFVKVDIPKGVPSGKYLAQLEATDSAGNFGSIEVRLTVTNNNNVDLIKPRLLEVKTMKAEYHTGETVSILVRYEDDISVDAQPDVFTVTALQGKLPRVKWDLPHQPEMDVKVSFEIGTQILGPKLAVESSYYTGIPTQMPGFSYHAREFVNPDGVILGNTSDITNIAIDELDLRWNIDAYNDCIFVPI